MCEIKAIIDKIDLHPNQTLVVWVNDGSIVGHVMEVFKANLPKNAKCIVTAGDGIRMKVIADTYDLTRGLDPLAGYVEGTLR